MPLAPDLGQGNDPGDECCDHNEPEEALAPKLSVAALPLSLCRPPGLDLGRRPVIEGRQLLLGSLATGREFVVHGRPRGPRPEILEVGPGDGRPRLEPGGRCLAPSAPGPSGGLLLTGWRLEALVL